MKLVTAGRVHDSHLSYHVLPHGLVEHNSGRRGSFEEALQANCAFHFAGLFVGLDPHAVFVEIGQKAFGDEET